MGVRFDFGQHLARLQHGDDALARLEPVEPVQRQDGFQVVGFGSPTRKASLPTIWIWASGPKMLIGGKPMAPADLEIVEVVRRRDLDRAGALLGIGIRIGNDRDPASDQGQQRMLADEVPIAFVIRDARRRPRRPAWFRDGWSPP